MELILKTTPISGPTHKLEPERAKKIKEIKKVDGRSFLVDSRQFSSSNEKFQNYKELIEKELLENIEERSDDRV
jgi:hypothetical protein